MSGGVGGSERKTVCVMSPNFALHIHVFLLLKHVAGNTEKESGENRSSLH